MRESNIVYERAGFWVYRGRVGQRKPAYVVFRPYQNVASVSDSAYPLDGDGLSLARARVDYLAKHARVTA